ncbi:ATP-binding protein [Herbiconiux sp. KACC 21604]|uniref:ATP-binding protein n=1 Tax=unclassified Herbiconiux TaxID=2618217 RepID=UPI001492AB8D|nr:ATP-binding protein [Herbiconiux sp. SALV-R1]QJU53144.1 ATP-binding protein [Herbiconiux sp. SALV-R1]WPO88087.1 ATP-binding protein [Herbiconiux sp. KACC 21604]
MTEERRNLVFSSPPDDVDAVHEFLESVWEANPHVGELDRMAFETALIELASNVIQHAAGEGGVTCVLTVLADESGLSASLADTADAGGIVLMNREMPSELAESGRGIALIQALVDDLRYERVDERNVWTITRAHEAG